MTYTHENFERELMKLMPSPEECNDPYKNGYADAIVDAYELSEDCVYKPPYPYRLFISFYFFDKNGNSGVGNCSIEYLKRIKKYEDITDLEKIIRNRNDYEKVVVLNYHVLGVE